MAHYDEKRIASITHEVAEAIEEASFGKLSWAVAAEIFSSAFPGGYAALVNHDFIHNSVEFLECVNMDEAIASSYAEHYAYINPWARVFTKMPSGSVCVAEKHLPARTFVDTEFYNDWLVPQGDVLAGVGLKVDASPTDVVCFPVHYPSRFSQIYDDAATRVSLGLVGAIERAIRTARLLRQEKEEAASKAAVTNRSWPAIVVDSDMRLCGANSEAEFLLSQGTVLSSRKGRISFGNPVLDQRVAAAVIDLAASIASASASCTWRDPHDPVVVQLSRLPKAHLLFSPLIAERTKILLVIKRLAHRKPQLDLTAFAETFGLTRSEMLLCLSLYAGRNLQEAAVELGVTYGTIRDRTKIVFQKTGVRGQPGLCALLARYAG